MIFRRQFLIQKKVLELRKNVGIFCIGQIHHKLPAGLLVFITTKYSTLRFYTPWFLDIFMTQVHQSFPVVHKKPTSMKMLDAKQ